MTPSGKRNLLVAVTIGFIVVLLLAAEAAVRVRASLKYGVSTAVEDYYTVDEKLGLRVAKANFTSGHVSTNALGFRGPDLAVPKPPGTLRLAFLGASTTWCAEVSGNEQAWPHLVTATLSRRFPAASFDYVNAGLPGYTMSSILNNLQNRVAPLSPDIIIVYEAANNLSGEMRDIAAARGLVPDTKVHEFSALGRYSMLWYLVEKNLAVLDSQRAAASGKGRLELDTSTIGDEYRRVLRQIVSTAQMNARLVAVATFSIQLRREQSQEQQTRAAASTFFYTPFVTTRLIMDGYDRYNQIAREVARETGALLVEGENDIPGDPAHFNDTIHFTDAGSEAMAGRISRALIASSRFTELLPNGRTGLSEQMNGRSPALTETAK